ncbi:MAG: response regulator transcription factor [Lachnospiraceae bacterium]|nr:response regulator transcription factor [Lachnospiraceae bacterium]
MIKILIVEDDENIAKMIRATVTMGGYDSEICSDGPSGLEQMNSGNYDLILLDIMLPGMDGFEVISKRTNDTPVIFITAKQDVLDKVSGLKLGAEDYIVKPFETVELLARIEVVLRRYNKKDHILQYKDITINTDEHTCRQNHQDINLTPKEFDLIVFFIQHQDVAISRSRLLSAIWGYYFEGESRTVDIHIQQLRKKLSLKNYLITIPKLGYRLNKIN